MKSYPFLDPPTKPGDLGQLGHYRVIDEIGKGGMGHVFRAEDVKLKRSVALKVMNRKIAATPHSRRRFLHEARAMAAVHHDNVVTIFEVGESKGTPFMAMEMLRGRTLEELNVSKQRLEYDEIIELARQMSKGLEAAHAKGIVHRDIKPANIWIEQDSNRVKILDFGLALASSPIDHLAGRGAVVGTPGYLSPEQARSEPLDDRSDLYSLGVVLYELCTGRLPSNAKSVSVQLISILVHRPMPIGELNPEIPGPLCDLVHRLLRKEPRARPGSAKLLQEQLDKVEGDCHSKSEVAQAINKLQLGLQEVVNKQNPASIFDVETVSELDVDPLASSPVGLTTPAARTLPTGQSAPVGRPIIAAPMTGKPSAGKPASAATAWMAYWPLAAVLAVILIALPILTFLFTGVGRSSKPRLITEDPVFTTSPQTTPSATRRSADPLAMQPLAMQSVETDARRADPASMNRLEADEATNDTHAGRRSPVAQQSQSSNTLGNQTSRDPAIQVSKPSIPSPSAAPAQFASAGRPVGSQPAQSLDKPASPDGVGLPRADASPPAEPPQAARKWTTISTADGRGADAMVQIGTSQRFGSSPSIGVHSRGEIETNHSYLRFDLAAIEETRAWADEAELVLSVIGDQPPIGANLRVFAVDAGMWPEEKLDWKKSFSHRGLDSLRLLAEYTAGSGGNPEDGPRDDGEVGRHVIRINSTQLAGAIANSPHDVLTLVIAGTGLGDSILRFASRERSASAAPQLVIRTPSLPPEQARAGGGGRGGVRRPSR